MFQDIKDSEMPESTNLQRRRSSQKGIPKISSKRRRSQGLPKKKGLPQRTRKRKENETQSQNIYGGISNMFVILFIFYLYIVS